MERQAPKYWHWVIPVLLSLVINAAGVVFGMGSSKAQIDALQIEVQKKVDKDEFREMKEDVREIRRYLMEKDKEKK